MGQRQISWPKLTSWRLQHICIFAYCIFAYLHIVYSHIIVHLHICIFAYCSFAYYTFTYSHIVYSHIAYCCHIAYLQYVNMHISNHDNMQYANIQIMSIMCIYGQHLKFDIWCGLLCTFTEPGVGKCARWYSQWGCRVNPWVHWELLPAHENCWIVASEIQVRSCTSCLHSPSKHADFFSRAGKSFGVPPVANFCLQYANLRMFAH